MLTLIVLVVFKSLLFIFFRKELLTFFAECFVLFHFLLDVLFSNFDESIFQRIELNVSLHFRNVAFNFAE